MSFDDCEGFIRNQINGCRYLIPKYENVLENVVPLNGSEVYVCKLPLDCLEMELFRFVSTVGPVYELRLMVTFSGANRGFAYVRYYNPETAEKAIKELPLKPIRLNPLSFVNVQKSTDHRSLLLVGMNVRNACSEIQKLFNKKCPGQLTNVVELQTEKPMYAMEFISHKSAALSKRLNEFPAHWGSTVRLMWVPNEEVESRIKQKKERVLVKQVFQEGRQMYLKHEVKSLPLTGAIHQPTYAKAKYDEFPSQPLSPLVQNVYGVAPVPQAAYSSLPLSQPPYFNKQHVYGEAPSTAQATLGQPSSKTCASFTQVDYDGALSNPPAALKQPSSRAFSCALGVYDRPPPSTRRAIFDQLPSTTQFTYDQPSSSKMLSVVQGVHDMALHSNNEAINPHQRSSASQATYDQVSSLPCTTLTQPTFAGLDNIPWKSSADLFNEDRSFLNHLNSSTTYHSANVEQKPQETLDLAGASAAFGYYNFPGSQKQKENVPVPVHRANFFCKPEPSNTYEQPDFTTVPGSQKPKENVPLPRAAVFRKPEPSDTYEQSDFTTAKVMENCFALRDDYSLFSTPDWKHAETKPSFTKGGSIAGKEDMTSPPSPSKKFRF